MQSSIFVLKDHFRERYHTLSISSVIGGYELPGYDEELRCGQATSRAARLLSWFYLTAFGHLWLMLEQSEQIQDAIKSLRKRHRTKKLSIKLDALRPSYALKVTPSSK